MRLCLFVYVCIDFCLYVNAPLFMYVYMSVSLYVYVSLSVCMSVLDCLRVLVCTGYVCLLPSVGARVSLSACLPVFAVCMLAPPPPRKYVRTDLQIV